MPEGDTILKAARTLHASLAGKRVDRCTSPIESVANGDLEGHVITAVEARGKHLLVRFDDGRVLHTHMRMHGAWHLYAAARPLRIGQHTRVVLTVGDRNAVCYRAPVVRLLSAMAARAIPGVTTLGPDVLGDAFDAASARRGIRTRSALSAAEALLAQRLVAGIGNVIKSEVLFICKIDPFGPVGALSDEQIDQLLLEARRVMKASLTGARITRSALSRARLWVYQRGGEACYVCREPIAWRRAGDPARVTYFCPRCQDVAASR